MAVARCSSDRATKFQGEAAIFGEACPRSLTTVISLIIIANWTGPCSGEQTTGEDALLQALDEAVICSEGGCTPSAKCDIYYCRVSDLMHRVSLFGRREIGEIVRYVYGTKNSPTSQTVATARITPNICQGQPPTVCSRFHPNRFTFGIVIAERVKTAIKSIKYSRKPSFQSNNRRKSRNWVQRQGPGLRSPPPEAEAFLPT